MLGYLPSSIGRVIELWRRERNLTQEELAERAGVPRPNLSMIEQGARDLTLSTLRRLAGALEIKPGLLADGISPQSAREKPWSRESLDRIARYLLGYRVELRPREREAAESFRPLIRRKLALKNALFRSPPLGKPAQTQRGRGLGFQAFFQIEEIRNLISRIDKLSGGPR